jgi:ferredoxin
MAARFIAYENIEAFLERLRLCGELHGPLRSDDGVMRFAAINPGILPDLSAIRTQLPPKKYLLCPQETILNYSTRGGYRVPVVEPPPLILLGVHSCDLAGINYLDQMFLKDDPDPLYAARRSNLTLIGISCTPDEFCSCHLSRSQLNAFSDLFLQVIEGGFTVTIGSSRGYELLEGLNGIIEEQDLNMHEDTRRFFGQIVSGCEHEELDAALPEWQELADHCLGCGTCSLCCPTCSCFDVLEFGGLDGSSAVRMRQWDNCLLRSHGELAGGMNFRKDRAERFRYRYRHKYRGFGPLQGILSCVGCGRCRVFCPAGLDLRLLAEQLEGRHCE